MTNIQLSDHFTYQKLLRFTLPSITMMLITSIYGVVDGLFVSNLLGKQAFAAVNLVIPFLILFDSVSFMLSTGGSALVAKTIGKGDEEKGSQIFSMIIYVIILFSVVCSTFGIIYLKPMAIMLGAADELLDYCISYGRILFFSLPFFMIQVSFQIFLVVAEKPKMGLLISITVGLTNVALDVLFIYIFRWGIEGAAAATAISEIVGGAIPFIYFLRKNKSILRITRPEWDGKALLKSCTNGSSEMMTNLSMALVNMLYNFQLIKLAGANGVAAYGLIMYVNFIFSCVFIGFSMGSAPLISYHYGADNHNEMKNLLKKSILFVAVVSLLLTGLAQVLARPLAMIFVGYDPQLLEASVRALRYFSISYLFCGSNIFATSFFTALNNGLISGLISFLRTLAFQTIMIFLLPMIWGVDGIWFSVVIAEALTLLVTSKLLVSSNNRYHYF